MFNDTKLIEYAAKKWWVVDVDDCLYDIACGLHSEIKRNIVNTFNRISAYDPDGKKIVARLDQILTQQNNSIANPEEITADELGVAFPPIVQTLSELKQAKLFDYLNQFYGDEYHRIRPSRDLVRAFEIAAEKGIKIYFYTNGPSSPAANEISHLQNVMKQRGFSDNIIEAMRPNTYDLLMSIKAGFGKPTIQGMKNFLEFSKVNPKEALMFDDGPKNLATAHKVGISTVWTWTTDTTPKDNDIELAKHIGATRVRDTSAAMLQIALAR